MKGDRIVIPKSLRKDMLHRVHYSHLGIEKCKQRARDVIFWPGMCSEIEKLIQGCLVCQEKQNANAKEPLLPRKIPERPWQVVASDLFSLEKVNYVIVVDYYSRFFEIERLKDTLSSTVVKKTKAIFSRHGIPEELVSDNGPQFISQEYKQFTSEWDIVHTTSSPEYPQSNGLAEKAVQTAKNILQKAINDKKDPYLCLLEYRNTPVDNFASPAQLLMSRSLRSILPVLRKKLEPNPPLKSKVVNKRKLMQQRQVKYYNKGSKELKPFKSGDKVRVKQKDGKWEKAVVSKLDRTPRSYHVRTEDGGIYRRNRRVLRESKEHKFIVSYPDLDISVNREHKELKQATQHQGHTPDIQPAGEKLPSTDQQYYCTRSGRTVKPPDKLNL